MRRVFFEELAYDEKWQTMSYNHIAKSNVNEPLHNAILNSIGIILKF